MKNEIFREVGRDRRARRYVGGAIRAATSLQICCPSSPVRSGIWRLASGVFFLLLASVFSSPSSALEIANAGISNITRVSVTYYGSMVSTNGTGTNPVVSLYYGPSDGLTNASNWSYSVSLTNVALGSFSTNIAGLTPAKYYYFRPLATEGTNTAWASASTSFWTVAGAPTGAYPAATGGVFQIVGTNGGFLAPAAAAVISANNLATSNSLALWSLYTATSSINAGTNAIVLGGESRTNWPAAGYGSGFPLTNNVDLAGYRMTNGSFEGDISAGTNLPHTNLVGVNDDPDVQHLTAAEKAFAMNPPSTNGLASTNWVVAQLSGHTNTGAMSAHPGLGTAATNDVSAFVATNDPRYLAALTNETSATNIAAGASDSYNAATRTLTWNTNAADLSAWSSYDATQQIVWVQQVISSDIATNLMVTGTDFNPPGNISGVYYEAPYSGGRSWTNIAGSTIGTNVFDPNIYYLMLGDIGYWYHKTTDVLVATGNYFNPLRSWTATAVENIVTNIITNTYTWKAGYDAASSAWRISRDGTDIYRAYAGSNVFLQPVYGDFTNNLMGATNIAAGSADSYDSVSRTLTWNTNAASGGTGSVSAVEGTYPVIRLELGGAWTDFEIKASTNNFTNLVYYYISSDTNAVADDYDPYVYFSDDYRTDVRQWVKATNHVPIYTQLSSTNSVCNQIYLFPSTNTLVPACQWMQATNAHLVWSWVRFDGIDFEKNADGSKQRWNLVRPERWEMQRTTP
jgi:hypothetical protein